MGHELLIAREGGKESRRDVVELYVGGQREEAEIISEVTGWRGRQASLKADTIIPE